MSFENRNRGKESNDDKLFSIKQQSLLKEALADLSYLLSRGYGQKSAVQLTGNRYRLNARQQKALMGMGASKQSIESRKENSLTSNQLKNKIVEIDGFNQLITLEGMISSAYIFKGLDGFYRDISGVHGSYKRVAQSEKAINLIGAFLERLNVKTTKWILDRPVSNSGRLKTQLLEIANHNNWNWEVELENTPDKSLAKSSEIVVSSDAWVLDEAAQNFNLLENLRSENEFSNIVDLNLI